MASLFLRGFGAAGADGIFNRLCFCSLQLAVIFYNKIQNPVDALPGDRKIGNVNQGSHQEHDQRQRDQRRLNEFIPKLSNSLFIHSDVLPVCLSAILLPLQSDLLPLEVSISPTAASAGSFRPALPEFSHRMR